MAAKSSAVGRAGHHITRPSLSLTRSLKAWPEKGFAAWTEPQKIVRWFGTAWVKPGTERASIDARIGGRYRVSFDTDHGEHYEVGGIYREVEPNRRLVFSWAWHSRPERESLVTVPLKPDGDGTLLTSSTNNRSIRRRARAMNADGTARSTSCNSPLPEKPYYRGVGHETASSRLTSGMARRAESASGP